MWHAGGDSISIAVYGQNLDQHWIDLRQGEVHESTHLSPCNLQEPQYIPKTLDELDILEDAVERRISKILETFTYYQRTTFPKADRDKMCQAETEFMETVQAALDKVWMDLCPRKAQKQDPGQAIKNPQGIAQFM